MMIPNSYLWSLGNVQFALVVRASSVLIFPDTAKKDFSPLIRRFLYRMHFWNAFQALKTPYHKPEQREEYAGHWCLCHHNRGCWCGKEANMAFLSKKVLGMEFVYICVCTKQPRCLKSCFMEFFRWPFCPVCKFNPVLFSPLVQTRHRHVSSDIHRKVNTFEVSFMQWKFPGPHKGSKAKSDQFVCGALSLEDV